MMHIGKKAFLLLFCNNAPLWKGDLDGYPVAILSATWALLFISLKVKHYFKYCVNLSYSSLQNVKKYNRLNEYILFLLINILKSGYFLLIFQLEWSLQDLHIYITFWPVSNWLNFFFNLSDHYLHKYNILACNKLT